MRYSTCKNWRSSVASTAHICPNGRSSTRWVSSAQRFGAPFEEFAHSPFGQRDMTATSTSKAVLMPQRISGPATGTTKSTAQAIMKPNQSLQRSNRSNVHISGRGTGMAPVMCPLSATN